MHTHLQHVHLRNFVPTQYRFRPECKIHGTWSPRGLVHHETDFADWASSDILSEGAVASISIRFAHASVSSQGDVWVKPFSATLPEFHALHSDRHSRAMAMKCDLLPIAVLPHLSPLV